jgi:2,3-dihydro-2,3-dihydroxybenzoate dehydrogenase
VLVNAAGILRMGATDELSLDAWQQTFAVNVGGAFNLFQQTMGQFRRQQGGAIVTVASDAAHTPRIGMSAYGASKAALKSLALTVGLELAGSGVRCNLVSPGSTDTDMQRTLWVSEDAEQRVSAVSASSLSSGSRWVKLRARRRLPARFCSSLPITPAISRCRISWWTAARRWGRKWPGNVS